MPRKKLERTSSLNKHYICDNCDKKFNKKIGLSAHDCMLLRDEYRCKWCNVVFKSRACLANHATNVHGDMCYTKLAKMTSSESLKCNVCSKMFAEYFQLRYHIRRTHFNMKAKLPYCLQKKVNQVWFEKVLNCNNVMEIRKAGPNLLVMRKLAENTAMKVANYNTEEIDVTHLYPTGRKYEPVICKICSKQYGKRELKKHMEEVHFNKIKHHCNNCNLKFKRLYLFLKHMCHSQGKRRVRKNGAAGIKISNVQSVAVVQT